MSTSTSSSSSQPPRADVDGRHVDVRDRDHRAQDDRAGDRCAHSAEGRGRRTLGGCGHRSVRDGTRSARCGSSSTPTVRMTQLRSTRRRLRSLTATRATPRRDAYSLFELDTEGNRRGRHRHLVVGRQLHHPWPTASPEPRRRLVDLRVLPHLVGLDRAHSLRAATICLITRRAGSSVSKGAE